MGYLRKNGSKGIRNHLLVVYTVECASFVAKQIQELSGDLNIQVIGSGGCAPNDYITSMMHKLCTHPNVGGVLIISLGCENLDYRSLANHVKASGRPVENIIIQECGGTAISIKSGLSLLKKIGIEMSHTPVCEVAPEELIIGTICGGSDGYSGITSNPAIGLFFDHFISNGGTGIFEEGGELIGCTRQMAERSISEEVRHQVEAVLSKTVAYYAKMGNDSFSLGNATGGLSTIIEKSLGAYCKSGQSPIAGVIQPGDVPQASGLYFMDVVPDGDVKWGFPNVSDNAEIIELIACGAHIILFSTGRGSVVGSAISPVIKICSNTDTYHRLPDDIDINAGKILDEDSVLSDISMEIATHVESLVKGKQSKSEALGHAEFFLGYKYFNNDCQTK
ncbi:Altronate dehydratase [termite gut metagenome]|uniref:Altronate dehydratase n=1 Tax=termite gut metagenome TaxID=433724 RepID=A0A5J4SXZ6_9ZZZZ